MAIFQAKYTAVFDAFAKMASNEVKTLVKNRKKIKNKTSKSFFSNDIQSSAQVVSYEYQTYISCGAFDGFPGHDVAEAQIRVSLNSK